MLTTTLTTVSTTEFERCMHRAGIPSDLADRFDENARDNLEAYVTSSADNTLASFCRHAKLWTAWSLKNSTDPLNPSPRDVRAFIRHYENGRKPNTIKGMVANIGVLIDGIAGNANVTRTRVVKAELKRIRREKGCAQRQALAIRLKGPIMDIDEPALPFSIQEMIAALEPLDTLSSARACFIMSLGGDTGRRCAEYRAANIGDLTELPQGDGLFTIRRSKTDQDGEGLVKFASKRTMRLFQRWCDARRSAGEKLAPSSPLLINADRWGHPGERIGHRGFNIMLRNCVQQALLILADRHPEIRDQIGAIVAAVSSHSFRVGLVEDLTVAGESIVAICTEGSWETPASVVRYARGIAAGNGASARLRKRVGNN